LSGTLPKSPCSNPTPSPRISSNSARASRGSLLSTSLVPPAPPLSFARVRTLPLLQFSRQSGTVQAADVKSCTQSQIEIVPQRVYCVSRAYHMYALFSPFKRNS
jgi:hypothetical protein